MKWWTRLQRHWWALALWSVLCSLFFSSFLSGQEHFSGGDSTGQFYAFGLFQAREMAQGHLPVWSPGSFGGIPFAADTQAAVFYPLRWLTILFSLPWDFPYFALELEVIGHVWLTGLFIYALGYAIAKSHIAPSSQWVAQTAGLMGAVAFSLSGYLASYPLSQLAILETITWLPLVLLLIRTATSREKPLRWMIAAGLVLALSGLAGHPQSFLHVGYMAAAYYLFLAIRARWHWSWLLGLGGLLTAVTLGVWMVAWLPAIRFLTFTVRSNISYKFVATGVAMLDFVQVLVPGSLGAASASYVGLATVLMALLAWYGRKKQSAHHEITFWAIMTILAAWLALGNAGIIFELAYRILPGFSLFRQQERLLGIFCFSLAMLAVQGIVIWWQSNPAWRQQFVRRALVIMMAGLGIVGIVLLAAQSIAQPIWLQMWGQQVGLTAVILILLWLGPQRRWPALLLILLLAADLYRPSLTAVERQMGSPTIYWSNPAWLANLPTDTPARIDSDNRIFANVGEAFGIEDIRGISPLKPQVLADLGDVPLAKRYQLMNVQHILADTPPEDFPLTAVAPQLYRFENAMPRAWMSYQAIAAPDANTALEQVINPAFDPMTSVVLHPPLPDLNQIALPDSPPQVTIERLQANELTVSVNTAAPGLLVLSEWAYPGWQATVNGRAASLHPANYAFQTLALPAGTHQISLRFVPVDVIVGGIVSLLTLLTAVFIAWRWQPTISFRAAKQRTLSLTQISLRLPEIFNLQSFSFLKSKWMVLFVIWLGFALRVFLLGSQELRGDEAFSYLFASQPTAEIIGNLLREGDPHSPFHYLLLHGWMKLVGDSEFAMRFLAVVPGVLLIPLVYKLGKCMAGEWVGKLTAVFVTISQSQIWLAQDVRNQYELTLLFTTLATWLLVKITQTRVQNRWLIWGGYAVCAALAVYSHYYGIFALLAHGLYLLFHKPHRRILLFWLSSGLTAVALFAIWFVPMWPNLVSAGQVTEPSRPKLAPYLIAIGSELTSGSALEGGFVRWLFLGTLGLCLLGIRSLHTKKSGGANLLASWLGSAVLGIFLVRFSRATFNNFYISVAAPAWWLLTAVGIFELDRHRGWLRLTAWLGTLVLLVTSIIGLNNYYFNPNYSRTQGYREAANYINDNLAPNDLFLAHFPDPSLDYYLRDVALPRQMQPAKRDLSTADTEQALSQLTDDYDRIWFIPYHRSVWDREDIVPRWLDFNTLAEQKIRVNRIELAAYRPITTIDAVITPLAAEFTNGPLLNGVFITVNGIPVDASIPTSLAPGTDLDVTLVWQTQQPIPESYTVFVHLLDENGALVTQHDGIPSLGTRPTLLWPVDERLLDTHELTVPPNMTPGNGRIIVGMYHTETLTRQLFADGQDFSKIAEVVFEP